MAPRSPRGEPFPVDYEALRLEMDSTRSCRELQKLDSVRTAAAFDDICTKTTRMTEGIWALPDDIICTILACLPLVSLLRFRSVCKKWRSFLQDKRLLETRARLHGGGELHKQYIELAEKSPWFFDSQVIASAGGLLLLTAGQSDDVHIIDPSTACLKQIPQMPKVSGRNLIGCGMVENQDLAAKCRRYGSQYYTVGMVVVNPQTKVYNVVAVSHVMRYMEPIPVYLYESGRNAWRAAGSVPTEPSEVRSSLKGVAFHDNALHGLLMALSQENLTARFRAVRYDKEKRSWCTLAGAFPALRYDNRSSPLLFEHGGRLLLAGVARNKFCIWTYGVGGGCVSSARDEGWVLQNRLPQELLSTAEVSEMGFFIQSCGNILCVGTFPRHILWGRNKSTNKNKSYVKKIFVYNILDGQWKELCKEEVESQLVCWFRRKFFYDSSSYLAPPSSF